MAGGIGTKKARLADVVAEDLEAPEALRMIERIIDFYAENGKKNERVGRMIERIGLDALCGAVAGCDAVGPRGCGRAIAISLLHV